MRKTLHILILETEVNDLTLLNETLKQLKSKDLKLNTHHLSGLKEAVLSMSQHHFDLIILEIELSDKKGLNDFIELRKQASSVPIILIGQDLDQALVQEAIHLGAQDYIPKSEITAALLERMIHFSIERERLRQSLKDLSFTDELTGLYNRRGFNALVEQQIGVVSRINKGFYLFVIDLDHLKNINDTHGHLMGDRALVDTANCLKSSFRHHDIIGRIGGDEFAVMAISAAFESGDELKNHLLRQLNSYNQHSTLPFQLSFSIGTVYYDGSKHLSLKALFSKADRKLYQEKERSHKKI